MGRGVSHAAAGAASAGAGGMVAHHRLATYAAGVVSVSAVTAYCATRRLRSVLRGVRSEAAEAADRQSVEAWVKRTSPPATAQHAGQEEGVQEDMKAVAASAKRIIIGGMMGSGKTTLAKELSSLFHLPHIPVDELYHLEGATQAGEWRGSAMDIELRRRMDAAIACRGGWIVEANPWQIPTWVWDDQGAEVLWLDYDNAVNYIQLVQRAARTWWTGKTATHDDAQDLTASFWSQLTNCAELVTIVYKWGEENRSGWRDEERFRPPRALRFTTPAELQLWVEGVRAAVQH